MKRTGLIILLAAGFNLVFAFPSLFDKPFSRETLMKDPADLVNTGLLDPSRFSMSHSYSMSYMTNGGQSDMLGLYLNHIRYQFAVPLTLQIDWGYAIRPLDIRHPDPNVKSGNLTLPRIALQYQPTKNTFISFEYLNLNGLRSRDPLQPFYFLPPPK